jgi:hypothetical protein
MLITQSFSNDGSLHPTPHTSPTYGIASNPLPELEQLGCWSGPPPLDEKLPFRDLLHTLKMIFSNLEMRS